MQCPLSQPSDNPAIIDGNTTLSYRQCHRLVAGAMYAYSLDGIQAGSVVALTPEFSIDTIITLFALFRLGAIVCPLSARLPKSQIPKQLIKIQATHHIIPKRYPPSEGPSDIDLSLPATYLFTSGSTGSPKIAIHTLGNHIYSALGINSYFKLSASDRWHLSLPLYHVGGLAILFRTFLAGATVVLKGPYTHASWVPTQLKRALEQPLPDLKAILVGGQVLPKSLALRASHLPIFPSYGLTEMSSTVLIKNTPLPYRRVRITNGELHVAGPTLFQGYLGEMRKSSWFATGDLVDNQYTILGRKDRLFISGGENIQPEEIERALFTLPGISKAYVVPVTDAEFGKRPVAFTDSHYSLSDIHSHLRDILPGFKLPIAHLPLLPNVDKAELSSLIIQAEKHLSLKN